MIAVEINGTVFHAPESLQEVSIGTYRRYLDFENKNKPQTPLTREKVSRPGVAGFFRDPYYGKTIEVIKDDAFREWEDYAAKEVQFWYNLPKDLMKSLQWGDINGLHAAVTSRLQGFVPDPEWDSAKYKGKIFRMRIYPNQLSMDSINRGSNHGIKLQALMSQILRDEKGKSYVPRFWKDLNLQDALNAAHQFQQRQEVASILVGMELQKWALYDGK